MINKIIYNTAFYVLIAAVVFSFLYMAHTVHVVRLENSQLQKQNQHYKKGLEFYANKKNYHQGYDDYLGQLDSVIQIDKGAYANKILKGEFK